MKFRPLPQSLVRDLLKTEVDEISGPAAERLQKITRSACPRCHAAMQPRLHPQPFTANAPLPRLTAYCEECGAEITEEGLVLERGNAARVNSALPLLGANEDRRR